MADKEGEAQPRPTASGADRISALPDGVRELVLSYLPAHEAVRTSVLARSWRDLWTRSPALRITGRGSVTKFTQFMEQLVSRRHPNGDPRAAPASLDSWHLDFGRSDFDDEVDLVEEMVADEALMNRWIQSVVSCRVRVLQFRFSRDCREPLDLPTLSLVISKHLTKIELAGVAIFRKLNLSGCPELQDLKMEGCYLCSNEIQAPCLKHLTMADCFFPLMTRTKIRLLSLISLKFIECNGRIPFLGNMPSLETAIVTIDSYNCDDRCSLPSINGCGRGNCMACQDYEADIGHTNCLLFSGLSEATDLELPAYPEVVHKINNGTDGRLKLPEQPFASSSLKIVEIKCHGVDKTVIEMLKILTAFGVPLERINIQCSSIGSGCEYKKYLYNQLTIFCIV
nr:unnamed protein product [Digitaria exilis]